MTEPRAFAGRGLWCPAVLIAAMACGGGSKSAGTVSAGGTPAGGGAPDGGTATSRIAAFSVGPDETPTYPDSPSDPPYLLDLPDEHTTFLPLGTGPTAYLVFGASRLSGTNGGAVVLQTTDLQTFHFADGLGFARQVLTSPVLITQCNSAYLTEFDANYAAPGSVVQDPTLPPGNLIMIYEAENHCPGGVNQQPFYATIGFARSSDGGKTWPAPVNAPLGGTVRHPVLKGATAQPAAPGYTAMGDAIPSAMVDVGAAGDPYLYVVYTYHDGGLAPATDHKIHVARARLGADPLTFLKWFDGAFSQPGIAGLDSGVLPSTGCPNGQQFMPEISRNDDLGLYLMVFVCRSGPAGSAAGAWYYATATSLELQDWSAPALIQGSQFPVTEPCPGQTTGGQFDGWYPSLVSPGASAGHTRLTGRVFFQNGCDTGKRQLMSRTFTITPGP